MRPPKRNAAGTRQNSRAGRSKGDAAPSEPAAGPLKLEPKYGFYPWWPEDGDAWIHPRDVSLARTHIPSPRVFRRDSQRGEYYIIQYGVVRIRVKRAMWQEVPWEGFDVGNWVEVLSRGAVNTPRTGIIREMHWDPRERAMRYYIEENGAPIPKAYSAQDLRHVQPTPFRKA
jgi:hypothetical protein